jgi:hypothetical protein
MDVAPSLARACPPSRLPVSDFQFSPARALSTVASELSTADYQRVYATPKSFNQNAVTRYEGCKPLRINVYEKHRGGGAPLLYAQENKCLSL